MSTSARATTSITRAARCSCTATTISRSSTARSTRSGASSRERPDCRLRRAGPDEPRLGRSRRRRRPARRRRSTVGDGTRRRGERALQTWSDAEALADKDFAEFTARTRSRRRAAALDRLAWTPGDAGRGAGCAGRARASICGARSRRSLRTGGDIVESAAPRAAPPAAAARAAVRRQRVDGALLADAAPLRPRRHPAPPPGRGVPVFDAAHAHHRASCAPPRIGRRGRAPWRGRCPTGRAARASATRCSSSTGAGAGARWRAARSCSSSPTAGTAATRRAARRDGAAAAQLPSPDLAEPAHRHARLRSR